MLDATGPMQNDYSVEVNMLGKDLEPAAVTSILGLEPMEAARSGEPRRNGKGNGSHSEGFWAYEAASHDDVNECRDHQLVCLVDRIEPNIEKLRASGVERIYFYYTLSSFTGLMNIRFRPDTLAKLGRLDADLYVSCFDCFNPKHPFWQSAETEDGNLPA
ncbi:MAG: DUF4279 domain-containing protein [bacterium]|nr:DUF4279 domain-containing protein [Candidatus Kapabacteria bacterium]